jgi:shikimate kinase
LTAERPAAERDRRVLLLGMMGSGKSTVGRLLAERTGWPYHDNDALLDRLFGRTARETKELEGEPGLREKEAAALELGLQIEPPCIVGVAAGTILDARLRRLMRERGTCVWLRARPATLAERAAGAEHRAWLEGDALAWFEQTLAERQPLYEAVADIVIDTDSLAAKEIADRLAARLTDSG